MKTLRWWFLLAALGLPISTLEAAESAALEVIGTARVDITPTYPIRLTGYAARTNLASGREQTLWAKALALGSDAAGPRVLITVDNCGVPAHVVEEVAGRLALRVRLPRENFCVASSHTHSGPMVRGFAENIFVRDLTSEEAAASDRYTVELMDHLERVALAALRARRPGKLFRAEGRVGFGANRRTPGGPVDPALPILVARDLNGKVMAVVANYACHCTTLGHQVNRSHGDWAGFAQEFLEADHPGAQAMITIGCGADTNPSPRGGDDFGIGWARTHARALATQVQGLVAGAMEELTVLPRTAYRRVLLPFEATPDRAGWETRAKESGIVGYHARKNLDRLGRGVPLPTHLPYFVQTWSFGERYAMVFLAGEVVVDYALRLKRDYDPARLWITAYANDVPCYIPSKRILQEGGYEAETSLWYYDRPARLKPEVEDLIHRTVGEILAPGFRAAPRTPAQGAGLPPPRTAEQGLRAFRLPPGLRIEAVATEPLVESPVAIDFGSDGRLWVCEMRDYPLGLDGAGSPGGRIKVLTDRDGDGHFDEAKVVADELPYPTGLMAWRNGVLVGAAPDVLWIPEAAAPTRGVTDPRVSKRLSGFATHNYQARVNGLRWGLDGWVHASGGLFGGRIRSSLAKVEVDCSGRDFRFRPDTGEIEALSGVSQIVRCRDDYGEWFGNDNGSLLWHFPLAARYGRANPRVATPAAHVGLDRDGTWVFPSSETLERFNDPHTANHLTSACGPEIYRDGLLGKEYEGNAFVCEPVHNLVRRAVLSPDGITFRATRAETERDREFLASEDSWFRPVEVRTGPDGGLWVVDFHRLIVEHPRWIAEDRLRTLDVRAGADRGRIYRVIPEGDALRPVRAWAHAEDAALVQGLASSNGPARDFAQRELWMRHGKGEADRSLLAAIEGLARSGHPAARVQAWFTLAGLARENACDWRRVLDERDPKVLRAILPVWEGREGVASEFESWLGGRVTASGPGAESFPTALLFQVILSQGQVGGDGMGGRWETLARAMSPALHDPWIRAAVLASCRTTAEAALEALRPWDRSEAEGAPLWDGLLRTLAGEGRLEWVRRYWATAFVGEAARARMRSERVWVPLILAERTLVGEAARRALQEGAGPRVGEAISWVEGPLLREAMAGVRGTAPGAARWEGSEVARAAAIRLLGEAVRRGVSAEADLVDLAGVELRGEEMGALRAAWSAQESAGFAEILLSRWGTWPPRARSLALSVLLERESSAARLVSALERGLVRPVELDAAQRQRLAGHAQESVRRRAQALFQGEASRAEVVARYAGVVDLDGDSAAGRTHFEKLCATCHQLHGVGHAVGPDLVPFIPKRIPDFLVAILDPSAAIDPRYLAYDLVLKDGREVTGVVRSESAQSIELLQANGVREVVLRADVAQLNPQQRSLMPEGLETGLGPQDLADLVAWIRRPNPVGAGPR